MGLDIVEIVMRTEETFGITIPNDSAEQATTPGKLYEFVCYELLLLPIVERPAGTGIARSATLLSLEMKAWTHEEVWATLVALIADQIQVDPEEIRYDASWINDLGVD
jgi:acyl carrier protein